MNIALILAGGTDCNFQMQIPKQFVNVNNRPLIVYTMEIFQKHHEIDKIAVVCLSGWQEMVKVYASQFNITKLCNIISGGANGQESSYNGIKELQNIIKSDDIVVIHDAIRPFVSDEIISDSMRVCREKGNGVAAVCSMDTIMKSDKGIVGVETIDRYDVMRIQTPQAYKYGFLSSAHRQAEECGITGLWDACSMVSRLGEKIYFSRGAESNIKINTIEDVAMFKALYAMKENGSF